MNDTERASLGCNEFCSLEKKASDPSIIGLVAGPIRLLRRRQAARYVRENPCDFVRTGECRLGEFLVKRTF